MAPQPVSREGSVNSGQQPFRRSSSSTSRTNVFSDEYALDSPGSMGNITPVDSLQDSVDINLGPRENRSSEPTRTIPRSALPTPLANIQPSSSTSNRPPQTDSTAPPRQVPSIALSDAGTTRSFSTSSRLSIPRANSPYNGPTAPSHPYGMYPQVTRASSIASESTVQPMERPFVPQGGPEHPYAMYQNTVPEEDDEPSSNVPLAFPGMSSSFQGSRSSGNETGDIVGTDGHVETLPPYTRYADNVVDKGDMAQIDQPRTAVVESSPTSTDSPNDQSATELTRTGVEVMEDAEARKEGWRTRAKRRKCCGAPCWMVVVLVTVVLIAAAVGGIIGGVIGNEKGVKHGESASSQTTTVWLDADPVSTGSSTPPCPTGHFTMSLNQTNQVDQCISDADLRKTGSWDCMDVASLGVSIFDEGPGYPPNVVFDDYSGVPKLFRYGPQPPDFNRQSFPLAPFKDREDDEYGVAMFFSSLFDKIVILEEDQISPEMAEKRSVSLGQLQRRHYPQEFGYLYVGDNPWYCFWNGTVEEFWIFLEMEWDGSSPSTTTAAGMSMVTSTPVYAHPYGSSLPYTLEGPSPTTTYDGGPDIVPTSASTPWDGPKRRAFPATSDSPGFPKLVKMVEKRKPHSNVQPYCQQMVVKPNWHIVPKPDVPTVCIEEAEYSRAEPTGDSKRWISRFSRRGDDSVDELESMCICEWMSDGTI